MPWFEINLGQKADRKVAQNTFAASNWPRGGSCARAKSSGGRRHAVSLRFCFSAVLFDLILDLLPLVERAQSSALDCGDVDEHVFAARLRLNKSIALSRIERHRDAAPHCRAPK